MSTQLALYSQGPPGIDTRFGDLEHRPLDAGAWVDYHPGWLKGEAEVFSTLVETTRWRGDRRQMYDRIVDVPRLLARLPADGPGHPILAEAAKSLSARYQCRLESLSLAYYRDGRDSVALHGDKIGRQTQGTIVAIVSVGQPRRFVLKPAQGGPSLAYSLGWGDLLVMGGTCQRTWLHGVPKVKHAEARISIQFRTGGSAERDGRAPSASSPS